jgi:iron(III) transport system substrate-binding protein
MTRVRTAALAAACLCFAAFAGGSAQPTSPEDWNAVIAAAKKEVAVTMYANPGTEDQLYAAADAFEKKYGIKVTLSWADGATNTEKVMVEAQTGHVLADVYYAGLGPASTLSKVGYALPLDLPNAANLVSTFNVLKGATPLFVNVYGILVNTSKLGKIPLPKSWNDLLNPAFAGKMVMQDPRVDGGGGTFFVSTYDRFGLGFEQKLAALQPAINGAGGGSAAEEAVARGDYTVLIAGRVHALAAYPQAPLKWIAPSEGSIGVPIAMTLVKGAPHPNAGRLWANFLLEPAFQTSLSSLALPVVKNVAIKNPAYRVRIPFLEVLPPSQDRTRYYTLAKQLYGAR